MEITRYLSYARHPRRTLAGAKRRAHNFRLYGGEREEVLFNGMPRPLKPAKHGQPEVVVTLTSYGPRLSTVHLAIKSLMLQTVRPNKIVLYLGTDSDSLELPAELTALEKRGLEIRRGYANLKSHKKYYFAMSEFDDALIVMADDDLIYEADVIESLLAAHEQFPDCIVGRRTHLIRFDEEGAPLPYLDWQFEHTEDAPHPRNDLLITTGAGSLYPPCTHKALLAPPADFMRLAASADDIWLKGMEMAAGIKVAYAPNSKNMPNAIEGTQEDALFNENGAGGLNDQAFAAVLAYHNLTAADFTN